MFDLKLNAQRGNVHLDLSLQLTATWTVLFGISGSGKSSILRAISGLWQPSRFSISFNGTDLSHLTPHKRHIALVTHHASLVPHWTVEQNVRFAAADAGIVKDLLERFHIAHLSSRKAALLSGGEQQRVAMARALASRPRMLLLDEALSGLDLHLRSQLIATLKEEKDLQILSVTHNLTETLECADEVVLLEDGRITKRGTPREVLSERRDHLLQLLGN